MTWSLPERLGTCCCGMEGSRWWGAIKEGLGLGEGRSRGALEAPYGLQLLLWEQREPLESFEVKQDQPGEPSPVLALPGTSYDLGHIRQPPWAALAFRVG